MGDYINGYYNYRGSLPANNQIPSYENENSIRKNGWNGNDLNMQNKKDKNGKKVNATITKSTINTNNIYNQDLYNNNYQMEEEEKYYLEQKQCQEKLNMQLLLRRQKNYNNTFKNCYDSMKEYIKKPTQINKGNFLWNLDGCCAIVNLWKKDYPEYEPKFSKEFKKDEVVQEIKKYIKKFEENKNDEHLRIFNKFYQLLNNQKQDLENDKSVLKYFPNDKPTEGNVINTAHNLMGVQRKIAQETEKEEFYGFANYDVDEKIRHLRKKDDSCE